MRGGDKKRGNRVFEADRLTADTAQLPARSAADGPVKLSRRRTLTKVDRRSRLGRRISELTAMFSGAVVGEVTPLRKMKIDKAAKLTAAAEQARGAFLRNGLA
jgi:hypothetical protein